MAHKHRLYGSYPPWGKSVEFSAGGGEGNYVYYDIRGLWDENLQYAVYSSLICREHLYSPTGNIGPTSTFFAYDESSYIGVIPAIGFDPNIEVISEGSSFKLGDIFNMTLPVGEIPAMTKESFYSISGFSDIVIYKDGEILRLEYGNEPMKWKDWIESDYNTIGMTHDTTAIYVEGRMLVEVRSGRTSDAGQVVMPGNNVSFYRKYKLESI